MQTAHLVPAPVPKAQPARPGLAARALVPRLKTPRVLLPEASASEAFRVIALACLDRLRLGEMRLARTGDAEALHQARVALRQLRSAFSIFGPILSDERSAHLRGELKWLAATTNEARDLDVLIERMPEASNFLAGARERACAEARDALASTRARRLQRELESRLAAGWPGTPGEPSPADQPAASFASASLARLRRKVKKKGRNLRALDDAGLHELRIATKKLRYATEFFAGLFPSTRAQRREGRLLGASRALQDRLGELQDVAVAPALLERLQIPRANWPELPRRARLLKRADAQFAELIDIKPFWR